MEVGWNMDHDEVVYQLYGMTEEEIKVVEENSAPGLLLNARRGY